jgi:hypothetical protein
MANIRYKQGVDLEKFLKEILPKQMVYASQLAANEIAFRIRKDTIDAMRTSFHKPTPWTLRSIVVERTNNRDGVSAWVGLKHKGIKNVLQSSKVGENVNYSNYETYVLSHQFRGGFRKQKPWENRLIAKKYMPKGYFAVETEFCPKDKYDNPRAGFIQQLLSYFDARLNPKDNSTEKTRKRMRGVHTRRVGTEVDFRISKGPFSSGREQGNWGPYIDHLPMGIWQLEGTGKNQRAVPLFLFVPKRMYKQRIFIPLIANKIFAREANAILESKLAFALRTAKLD